MTRTISSVSKSRLYAVLERPRARYKSLFNTNGTVSSSIIKMLRELEFLLLTKVEAFEIKFDHEVESRSFLQIPLL